MYQQEGPSVRPPRDGPRSAKDPHAPYGPFLNRRACRSAQRDLRSPSSRNAKRSGATSRAVRSRRPLPQALGRPRCSRDLTAYGRGPTARFLNRLSAGRSDRQRKRSFREQFKTTCSKPKPSPIKSWAKRSPSLRRRRHANQILRVQPAGSDAVSIRAHCHCTSEVEALLDVREVSLDPYPRDGDAKAWLSTFTTNSSEAREGRPPNG